MNLRMFWAAGLAVVLGVSAPGAGAQERPVVPTPRPGPSQAALKMPKPQELSQLMSDFQGDDVEKREAAAKKFIEYGGGVLNLARSLEKHKKPEVAAKAVEVRQAIEKRAKELFDGLRKQYTELYRGELTEEKLAAFVNDLDEGAVYVAEPMQRRTLSSLLSRVRQDLMRVQRAAAGLVHTDKQLATEPVPTGVRRAAIQLNRATYLQDLRRHAEGLAAVQEGLTSPGEGGRLKPQLLKTRAELLRDLGQWDDYVATCKRILTECPRSLEVRQAYENLNSYHEMNQQYDAQLETLAAYLKAFPLDQAPQDLAIQTLDIYWEIDQQYAAGLKLADLLAAELDPSRLSPSVLRTQALGYEYLQRDYAKAEAAYKRLLEVYPDLVPEPIIAAAVKRNQEKAAGTFAKAPKPEDSGPAGAIAKFLAAIRAQDADALKAVTPKEVTEQWDYQLDQLTPVVLFSDVQVLEAKPNEEGKITDVLVNHFSPDRLAPTKLNVEAVQEDGVWKVAWPPPGEDAEDGDDMDGMDDAEAEPEDAPAPAKTPAPRNPKVEKKTGETGFVLPPQMPEAKEKQPEAGKP